MAMVGVSYPRYAKYNYDEETKTVSYGGAKSMGAATTFNIELSNSDDNVLYANNKPKESAKGFAGGTLKVGTDDLYDDAALDMLALEKKELTTPEAATELIRAADQTPPYMGAGGIVKHIRNGVTVWTGIILTKTQFSDPGLSVSTETDKIDWQTPELSATIMRDDTEKGAWQRSATFSSEANALAYIDNFFAAPATQSSGS